MSLLDEAMETFVLLDKTSTSDGYGGFVRAWTDGASFQGAVDDMNTSEVIVAQQRNSQASYNLVTRKNISLIYGDIVKRSGNSTYYRVTADGEDKHTPDSAQLDMRVVPVERLTALPT